MDATTRRFMILDAIAPKPATVMASLIEKASTGSAMDRIRAAQAISRELDTHALRVNNGGIPDAEPAMKPIDASPFTGARLLAAIELANAALALGQTTTSELDSIKRAFGGAMEDAKDKWQGDHFFAAPQEQRDSDKPLNDMYYTRAELHTIGSFRKRANALTSPAAKADALAIADKFQPLADAVAALKPMVKKRVILSEEEKRQKAIEAIPTTPLSQLVMAAVDEQKPAMAQDFVEYFTGLYQAMVDELGENWKPRVSAARSEKNRKDNRYSIIRHTGKPQEPDSDPIAVRFIKTVDSLSGIGVISYRSTPAIHYLDGRKLESRAKEHAEELAAQLKVKITAKAGELESPKITRLKGLEFRIEGEHKGKKVAITQSVKSVVNQNGTWFQQFPALIYVDGKFTPELAYKKWMVGKA